jgi:hypothetical protein
MTPTIYNLQNKTTLTSLSLKHDKKKLKGQQLQRINEKIYKKDFNKTHMTQKQD